LSQIILAGVAHRARLRLTFTNRADPTPACQRNEREDPQKNLIYQIQRRNKNTSKSNRLRTHFPRIVFAKDIVPTDRPGVTDHVEAFTKQICEVIVGKNQAVKLAVACLLARGHLLIEDIPGVGKTTLSQALARSLALAFQRIQFTSDLLPADILGNSIFDRAEQRFVFHRGPLFSQVVLIDEVNRATAKTQSALLEAMEEQRISVDGMTYDLPDPFFVIATQNPQHAVGTFPLPESQLDRFLMRIELGVPDRTKRARKSGEKLNLPDSAGERYH